MPDAHPCLYCGGTDFTVLHAGVEDRLRYAPGKRDWLKCRDCGSAVLFPFPAVSEIPSFYPPVYTFGLKQDKAAGRLQQFIARAEFQAFYRPQYESQAQCILRMTRVPRHGRMLDVGCGRGLRLLSFRRLGLDVHGMDLIPEPVEYVKAELGCAGRLHRYGRPAEGIRAGWVRPGDRVPGDRARPGRGRDDRVVLHAPEARRVDRHHDADGR